MRRLLGALIGFGLFFPGALVLRWLVVDEFRLYQEMSLTDALLGIIIILACVLIVGQPRRALTAAELEAQAEQMELASRRLSKARRSYQSARTQARTGQSGPRGDRSAASPSSVYRRSTPRGESRRPRRNR